MNEFQEEPQLPEYNDPQTGFTPPPRKKLWLYFLIFIVLGGAIFWGVRTYTLGEVPNEPTAYDAVTLKPKNIGFFQTVKNIIFHTGNVLAGEVDDRTNILLLGMGGPGHDGPYLTDTNIIISLKPSTKDVAFVSIPRDLGANIKGHGIYKINAANAFGEAANPGLGGEFARQTFATTFDLDIPYYIRVDFKAFTELIDTVGGVNIDVARSFTDTQFPGPNFSYQTISYSAGPQLMNGERALQYARSRHGNNGEGSDFARSHRQQQVLSALKEKLLSFGTYTNPIKIQQIITSLASHITTNLTFGQIMYMAGLAKEINGEIKTLVLDNTPDGYLNSTINESGSFILVPKTGNFSDINLAIKDIFSHNNPSASTVAIAKVNQPVFPSAKIEVQNGTWRVGLASRIQMKLQEKGFTVFHIGNSYKRPNDKTVIYIINQAVDKEIVNSLQKELNASTTTELPDWLHEDYENTSTPGTESGLKYKPETDLLVVLGEDANE